MSMCKVRCCVTTLIFGGDGTPYNQAGYEIVFCHPEAFLSCNDGLEVLQSSVYLSAVKAVVVDEAHCILEW